MNAKKSQGLKNSFKPKITYFLEFRIKRMPMNTLLFSLKLLEIPETYLFENGTYVMQIFGKVVHPMEFVQKRTRVFLWNYEAREFTKYYKTGDYFTVEGTIMETDPMNELPCEKENELQLTGVKVRPRVPIPR